MTPPENQIRPLPFTRRSAEEFLAARGREEYSQSSLHRYRCDLLQLERYLHGEPIGPDTLRAWEADMRARSYAPRTIVSRLTTVNGFLASAGRPDLRYLPEKVEPAPPRSPTWEEYLSALDAARRQGRRMAWLLMRVFGEMQLPQHALGELTVRAVRAGTLRATVNGRARVFAVPPRLQRELLDYAAARGIKNGPIFVSRSGSPIARNRIALELQQGTGGLQSRADMTSSRSLNHVRALPGAAIPGWADAS